MDRDISFVVRVCDAESCLADLVRLIDTLAHELCDRFEVLVIDDGSEEQTADEARRLAEERKSVRLITHPFTIGFSSGIKSALAHSQYPWLMIIPTDGSFVPEDIAKFVAQMSEYDLIVGYRPPATRPLGHRVCIFLTRVVLRLFFGISVHETNSAKLLKKDKLKDTIIESRGFAIGAEVIIKSVARGARMCHVLLSESPVPERKTDSRNVINALVGGLELVLFLVMRLFKLADFDPTGEDKRRVLR